jgi:shikimate kinase
MERIFLVGYMGGGKTTMGRILARQKGLSFVYLDKYIEGRYCKSIAVLFEEKGEEEFREIERRMLAEVSSFEDVVISTGGGTPCYHNNMEEMKKAGTTVYLRASVEELAARIEKSSNVRPLVQGLTGEELREFIRTGLAEREAFYNQAEVVWDVQAPVTGGLLTPP